MRRRNCFECGEEYPVNRFAAGSEICRQCVNTILTVKEQAELRITPSAGNTRAKKKQQVHDLALIEGFYERIIWGNVRVAKAVRIGPATIAIDASVLIDDARTIWRTIKPIFADRDVPPLDKSFVRDMVAEGRKTHSASYTSGLKGERETLSFGSLLEVKPIRRDYIIVGMKQCWNCGKYKEPEGFIPTHDTGDGLTHTCRACLERAAMLWGAELERRRISEYKRLQLMPFDKSSGIAGSQTVI